MDDKGYIQYADLKEHFRKSIMARLLMDEFFDWYNRPIKFTSMFRSLEHNAEVGGATSSRHLKDLAFDFLYPTEWAKWDNVRKEAYYANIKSFLEEQSQKYGVHYGLLKYSWGLHIDWCDRDYNVEVFM